MERNLATGFLLVPIIIINKAEHLQTSTNASRIRAFTVRAMTKSTDILASAIPDTPECCATAVRTRRRFFLLTAILCPPPLAHPPAHLWLLIQKD